MVDANTDADVVIDSRDGFVAGKPVIVGEFGSQRPMETRNAIYAAGESPS